jgi:hypothetical protein
MRVRKGIRKAMAWGSIAAFCAGSAGCLRDGLSAPTEPGAGASLRLSLAPGALLKAEASAASPPAIDSVLIRITGEDMAPIVIARAGDSLGVSLDGLPPGENRLVSAWLFRGGRLLYAGKALFAFRKETHLEASLRCDPQFSRVIARFHLPLSLPSPIAAGRLTLKAGESSFTADLEIRGEFGSFRLDEVPGDVKYDLSMALSDSAGQERYRALRAGAYLPLGEESKWDLSLVPIDASAGISLGLGAPKEAVVLAGFPSARREPRRPGEIVVSGFFAAPAEKDSGSQGEWFSLFNRSGDTLSLAGCRLSRDRGAAATRSYPFPSEALLPPGASLAFGRTASRAAYLYTEFSLVNTASSLLLLCAGDSLLADSLRYSPAAADSASALPMKEGMVTRLSAAALGLRSRLSSWCLARPDSTGPVGEIRDCP